MRRLAVTFSATLAFALAPSAWSCIREDSFATTLYNGLKQ